MRMNATLSIDTAHMHLLLAPGILCFCAMISSNDIVRIRHCNRYPIVLFIRFGSFQSTAAYCTIHIKNLYDFQK